MVWIQKQVWKMIAVVEIISGIAKMHTMILKKLKWKKNQIIAGTCSKMFQIVGTLAS